MKNLPASVIKKLPDGFIDSIQSMSDDELNNKILESEGQIYKIEDDLSSNEKIIEAKRELKEMVQPYRDTKKQEMAKIMSCLFVLESRGREIGKDQEQE